MRRTVHLAILSFVLGGMPMTTGVPAQTTADTGNSEPAAETEGAIGDAAPASAQDSAGTGTQPTPDEQGKTNWLMQVFGPGMWPLWICSIILLGLILERRRALQPKNIIDDAMIEQVADQISECEVEKARRTADQSETVLGKAWSHGLHEFMLGGTELDETLTNATVLAFKPLKKNLLPMATIGVISPLFGLLGTVLGMIITFHQIAATGGADKTKLAGGIGLALFTTAGGLIVGIPAILSNRFFQARLRTLSEQAEAAISRINFRYAHACARKTDAAKRADESE